jgi:membrane protein YqaA with SNARE-associated domain
MEAYAQATDWFTVWGSAVILIAGFTVIPFKIFTIMAGSMKMNIVLFLLASIISRGARFFIVAYASKKGGQMAVDKIMDHADKIGYFFMALLLVGLIWSVL